MVITATPLVRQGLVYNAKCYNVITITKGSKNFLNTVSFFTWYDWFFFGDEGQGWPQSDLDWPFWPGPGPAKLGEGQPRPTRGQFISSYTSSVCNTTAHLHASLVHWFFQKRQEDQDQTKLLSSNDVSSK